MARRSNYATFSPVSEEATFTSVADEAVFYPVGEEGTAPFGENPLDEIGIPPGPENSYLQGERHYVISSNVEYFQFFAETQMMYVGYKDGSVYSYSPVDQDLALTFYRAPSPGGAVWDYFRVRGTVFGFQVPYQLAQGHRVWNSTSMGRVRHGAISKSGEPYQGYHPTMDYKRAKGQLGPKAVDLGRKRSPHKIEVFTPVKNLGALRGGRKSG